MICYSWNKLYIIAPYKSEKENHGGFKNSRTDGRFLFGLLRDSTFRDMKARWSLIIKDLTMSLRGKLLLTLPGQKVKQTKWNFKDTLLTGIKKFAFLFFFFFQNYCTLERKKKSINDPNIALYSIPSFKNVGRIWAKR